MTQESHESHKILFVVVPGLLLGGFCHAQDLACEWQADRRVSIEGGWIEATQGADESSELLKLAVWGSAVESASCEQLSDDAEPQVVVISRREGTGPYYRLQIVDFEQDGISTRSYSSSGIPKIENGRVFLGTLPLGYQGAASRPVYNAFRYTEEIGLTESVDETSWLLVVTTTVDSEETVLIEAEFPSSDECSTAGQARVEQYVTEYQEEATFVCPSNREILRKPTLPTDGIR